MAVTVRELVKSRAFSVGGRDSSLPKEFLVYRSDDENEVYQALLTETDEVFDNLLRSKVSAKPLGGGVWEGTVQYGLPEGGAGTAIGATPVIPLSGPASAQSLDPSDPAMGGLEVTFDFLGETKHITQSIQTKYEDSATGGTPKDYKQAIGVSKDGVAGTDIFVGRLEMTVTQKRSSVTMANLTAWRSLVGTWNDATFWGYEQGEVLYLGGTGSCVQRGQWIVSHKFAIGENQVDVVVSPDLTIPSVDAWDYVWFTYVPDDTTGLMTVADVYVEQVYYPGDFSALGIGV